MPSALRPRLLRPTQQQRRVPGPARVRLAHIARVNSRGLRPAQDGDLAPHRHLPPPVAASAPSLPLSLTPGGLSFVRISVGLF